MKTLIRYPMMLLLGVLISLAACSREKAEPVTLALDVYKTPTCGCCGDWVTHMQEGGFQVAVHDQDDLTPIKEKLGIEPRYQSCHTAVTDSGAYFFEGHIPAGVIYEFLRDPPKDVAGLSVPAMPAGSPGMEMGDRFTPYRVYQIHKDGTQSVYQEIRTREEQYTR